MSTPATVTEADVYHLRELVCELSDAGRSGDATAVAHAHAAVQDIVYPWLLDLDDDDPEFVASMEAAERDIAEGRTYSHEEVLRRLQESTHA